MTQFKSEGQKVFPDENKETDNSAESSTVTDSQESKETNTDQTQSQEGDQTTAEADKKATDGGEDTNFADHPRWKERETDWTKRFNDQETRHLQEIEKLREEFGGKKTATADDADAASGEIPPWFNGDEDQWKQFQQWNESQLGQFAERAQQRETAKTEAEKKAIEEATKFFNDEVATIESDKAINPDGLKIDRNKLLKTAMDNDLVDSKGRWNYKAAFKFMKPAEVFQAKKALDDKKAIASATTSENRAEDKKSNVKTTQDFKGKNWGDL